MIIIYYSYYILHIYFLFLSLCLSNLSFFYSFFFTLTNLQLVLTSPILIHSSTPPFSFFLFFFPFHSLHFFFISFSFLFLFSFFIHLSSTVRVSPTTSVHSLSHTHPLLRVGGAMQRCLLRSSVSLPLPSLRISGASAASPMRSACTPSPTPHTRCRTCSHASSARPTLLSPAVCHSLGFVLYRFGRE